MNKDFASLATYRVLTTDKIEKILEASKVLLEDIGVSVQDERARELMLEYGAISGNGDIVKIPREVVAKALGTTTMPVTLYNRNREPALVLDTQNVYFASCSSLPMYLDPYTGESVELNGEHLKALSGRNAEHRRHHDLLHVCRSQHPGEHQGADGLLLYHAEHGQAYQLRNKRLRELCRDH